MKRQKKLLLERLEGKKMKLITEKWLRKQRACLEGIDWFFSKNYSAPLIILRKLIEEKHYLWASWLIVRVMNKKQARHYAMFCVEQVRYILEKGIPFKLPAEPIKVCTERICSAQVWGTTIYRGKPRWADVTTCAHFSACCALCEYQEVKKCFFTTSAQMAAGRGMGWALRADKDLSRVRILEYGMNLVGGKI